MAFFLGLFLNVPPCPAGEIVSKEDLLSDDDSPWEITAQSLTYKAEERVYIAEGDVVISRAGRTLYAQRAVYDEKTGMAKVSGDVRFEVGRDILTGDEGVFNLRDQTGTITKGRLFLSDNHFYVDAQVMEKVAEDTYLVKDCRVTTCDGVNPDWSITGSEVKVTVEGYGTVKHAAFRIRGIPCLYLPYLIFPAKTKRQTGLLPPRAGYSSRNGLEIEVPFFWALSDQTDATLYQRYMSERGYMQGMEFRYLADEDSKGTLLFDILSDQKDKDMNEPDDVALSPFDRTNTTRYWLRGMADQDLPHGWVARLDGDFVSDQDYLKEFEGGLFGFEARQDLNQELGRPVDEKRSPFRRSALRLSHDQDSYSLQVQGSYYQRPENPPNDPTAQPLGGMDFTFLPDQIGGLPLFFSLDSDYDYIWREVGERGHRVSITPRLNIPLWIGPYVEFEPFFKFDQDLAWVSDDPQTDHDRQYRKAYEGGARLSTNLERIYDVQWQRAKKLKHKISPVLSYTYRGYHDDERATPWFDPIDDEGDRNGVAFSLENYLDARLEDQKGGITYRQWGTFTLTQGYNIHEARRDENPAQKKEPFEPLTADLTVTPFPTLDLRGEAGWDHYDNEVSHATLSLEAAFPRPAGRLDIYKVDYGYDKDGQKSLKFLVDVNLDERFSVGAALEREFDLDENITQSGWVGYRSQCWGVKVGASREDDDTSVMVMFQLVGLGDVRAR